MAKRTWQLSTFEDSSKTSVVHLVWAVEDDDELAETAAHVFDGLRLSSSSRASWSATERHAKGLRQGDVAPVTQHAQLSLTASHFTAGSTSLHEYTD